MRSTLVALVVSAVFLVVATTVVPVRVRLEPKVLTCNTVLQHRGDDPIASALCRKAGAYRLRATFGIAALLAVLSLVPLVLRRRAELVAWGATMAVLAVGSTVLLAADGIRLERVFFDL
jgi:hypothetical protein